MPEEITGQPGVGTAPAQGADSASTAPGASAQPQGAAAPEVTPAQPQGAQPGAGPAAPQGPEGGAPPAGDSATATADAQRVADAQRLMHKATEQRAGLRKSLEAILGRPLTPAEADGRAPIAPPSMPGHVPGPQPPAFAQPPAQEPPGQPPTQAPEAFILDEPYVEDLFKRYSDPQLDEKGAFKLLVSDLGKRLYQDFSQALMGAVRADKGLLDATFQHFHQRAQESKTTDDVVKSVEGYWHSVAPQVPMELCWAFAREAERAHPNNIEEQAFYCLHMAIEKLGPALGNVSAAAQATHTMQREQGAVLPGGGGLPTGGGGEQPPSMVQQMRSLRGTA